MERANLPVETRYLRSDTHTVNGLTAYQLKNVNSTYSTQVDVTGLYYFGIRVWIRKADGTEVEVTGGSPVAVVPFTAPYAYASWNCPEVLTSPTDAVVVRLYGSVSSTGPWSLLRTWITEQLNASKLDAVIWTVYYYFAIEEIVIDYIIVYHFFRHGSATYPSRIGGFSYTPYTPPPPAVPVMRFHKAFPTTSIYISG